MKAARHTVQLYVFSCSFSHECLSCVWLFYDLLPHFDHNGRHCLLKKRGMFCGNKIVGSTFVHLQQKFHFDFSFDIFQTHKRRDSVYSKNKIRNLPALIKSLIRVVKHQLLSLSETVCKMWAIRPLLYQWSYDLLSLIVIEIRFEMEIYLYCDMFIFCRQILFLSLSRELQYNRLYHNANRSYVPNWLPLTFYWNFTKFMCVLYRRYYLPILCQGGRIYNFCDYYIWCVFV